jgi:hypothetical protein
MEHPKDDDKNFSFATLVFAELIAVMGGATGMWMYNHFTQNRTGDTATLPSSQKDVSPEPAIQKDPPSRLTMDEITDKVKKALVVIEFTKGGSISARCTGFIETPDTIATAKHCPGIGNDLNIDYPVIKALHEYPDNSSSLLKFNQNPGTYVFRLDGVGNHIPDIVHIKFNTTLFSDREPLPTASYPFSFQTGNRFPLLHIHHLPQGEYTIRFTSRVIQKNSLHWITGIGKQVTAVILDKVLLYKILTVLSWKVN